MLFPGIEGRYWIAMRISSGSECTPSFDLSCPQVLAMVLVAHVQIRRDLRVRLAFGEQRQNLQLAHGDGTEWVGGLAARLHEGDRRGELMAEIGRPVAHLLEGLHDLFRRRVLEDVAIGADLQRAAHDERIVVHAEHEDRGARVVQPQAADEGQAAERAGAHGEIDDDQVRLLAAIEAEAVGETLGLHDALYAGEFQQLAATLQNDRMVVDDEDLSHDTWMPSLGFDPSAARFWIALAGRSAEMTLRTDAYSARMMPLCPLPMEFNTFAVSS